MPELVDTSKQPGDDSSQDWMENFKKFKSDQKVGKKPAAPDVSEIESSIFTTTTNGGRKKKLEGSAHEPLKLLHVFFRPRSHGADGHLGLSV